jgi:hypothetical protein
MEQTVNQDKGHEGHGNEHEHASKTTMIIVNEKYSVTIQGHKATGMEIKEAAIAQGAPIQKDFNLFRINPGDNLKQVRDDETVTLHEGERFRAVTTDDNSGGLI